MMQIMFTPDVSSASGMATSGLLAKDIPISGRPLRASPCCMPQSAFTDISRAVKRDVHSENDR